MGIREDLMQVYEEHGYLTPELLVDVARKPDHPLHDRFNWDDQSAAEAFRHDQARELIRSVKIRYVSEDGQSMSPEVRAFTSVRTPTGRAYEPTVEVVTDPLKSRMVLADMRREWHAMRQRWEAYEEFWQLVEKDLPESLRKAIGQTAA